MPSTGPIFNPRQIRKTPYTPGANVKGAAGLVSTAATNIVRNKLPTGGSWRPQTTATRPGAAPAAKPPAAPGVLRQPGSYEQWFAANGKAPPITRYNPTNTRGAYDTMKNRYSGPSFGQTNARGVIDTLSGGTEGEGIQRNATTYFSQPNRSSSYADQTSGFFRTPGRGATNAYDMMGRPTASESNLDWVDKQLGRSQRGDEAIGYARRVLDENTKTRDYFNSDVLNRSRENTVGDESKYFLPGLREKSYSENLYESGNEGMNAAYDRAEQKRSKALSDRMAAMGVFGSGATARGLSELSADIAAEEARDQASLAQQADQARLGRTGAAESFAGRAGEEAINRTDLGIRGATASDEQMRANVDSMLNFYKFGSDEGFRAIDARSGAARDATDAYFKRGQLGLDADAGELNRVMGGGKIARDADSSMFEQGRGLADIGKGLSDIELRRLGLVADTGFQYDDEERKRIDALFAGGKNLDDIEKRAQDDYDEGLFKRWGAEGDAALTNQNTFQDRERLPLQDKGNLAAQKANLAARMREAATDEQKQLVLADIQAMVDAGQLDEEQANQMIEEMWGAAGLAVRARETRR